MIPIESAEHLTYRPRVADWAREALAAGLRSEQLRPFAVRVIASPDVVFAGVDDGKSDDVVDVDVIDDDPDEHLPGDDELVAEVTRLRRLAGVRDEPETAGSAAG